MKTSILLIAFAMLGATTTYAAEPKANGFYVGGVAGVGSLDDDGLDTDSGATLDSPSGGFGAFGGYKFLKYLAVEGRFTYLGSFKLATNSSSARIKPTALTANVIGILPLGNNGIELFGQLGIGAMFINDSLSDLGLPNLDDEATATVGVGIRGYATEQVALSLQYDLYGWEQKVDGKTYDLSSGALLAGVQWLF